RAEDARGQAGPAVTVQATFRERGSDWARQDAVRGAVALALRRPDPGGHRLGGEAELLLEHLVRRGGPEVAVADDQTVQPDHAAPGGGDADLDDDAPHAGGEDGVAVGGVLALEEVPARGRDDAHPLALAVEDLLGAERHLDLAAGGHDD